MRDCTAKRALFSATIALARLAICRSVRLAKPDQFDGSLKLLVAASAVPLESTRAKRALASAALSATAIFFAEPRKTCQAVTEVELTLKAPLLSRTEAERR